jgi:HEAT repeat protein
VSTLSVILLVIAFELVAVTFLLVTTLIAQARRSGGRIQRRRELWEAMLPAALAGRRHPALRIRASLGSRSAWRAFHSFIDEQLRHERGGSTLGFRRLSRHVGLTERLQRQLLRARDPLDRAAAGKTLARLRERIGEEKTLDLLKSEDPAVVLAAAYATAFFRDSQQFLPVFRAVYNRTPITLHGAAELLSGFEEGVCPIIQGLLEGVVDQYQRKADTLSEGQANPEKVVDRDDAAAQVVMTDLLAFYAYRPAGSTLVQLLSATENEEVLIHVVKAIAAIGDASAAPRLSELLTHPSWVVRRQSAQALAALRAVEAAPSMHALLDDSNLMVRATAVDTLRVLETTEVLREEDVVEALA